MATSGQVTWFGVPVNDMTTGLSINNWRCDVLLVVVLSVVVIVVVVDDGKIACG